MRPVQEWTPKHLADAFTSCTAARQKYRKLGREIAKLPPGIDRDNLSHTHSKLGIFLTEVLGDEWTEWIVGGDLARVAERQEP